MVNGVSELGKERLHIAKLEQRDTLSQISPPPPISWCLIETTLRVNTIILSCIEVLKDTLKVLICSFVCKLVQKAPGLIPRSPVILKAIIIFGAFVRTSSFQDIGLFHSPSSLYYLPAADINLLPSILYIV
jgi:hypothetical protein